MDLSPFPHQGPLRPDQVKGRDELVDDLIERATARKITALLGPRRFGKTSVLRKVESILTNAGTSVVWLDLYACSSTTDLVVRIDTALDNSTDHFRRRASSLAAAVSINLGMLKVEFARPPAQQPSPDAALHLVLDVLVEAATAAPTVIIIDEFNGLNGVDGAAGLLRTKLQHHVQDIGLLFAGSEPSVMATMFSDRAQPFYAQADIVEIQPFSPSELDQIISAGFEATSRDPSGLAAPIQQVTKGHPYRAMQLADAAWMRTVPGQAPDPNRWPDSLDVVQQQIGPALEALFSSFSSSEQAVLRSRSSNRPLFGSSLELFGTSSGAVKAARDRLISDGTMNAELEIVDPLLAEWIRLRFPL